MGGRGSGRKAAGVGKLKVPHRTPQAMSVPEVADMRPEDREVAQMSAVLTDTFAEAIEACETPAALQAFGTAQRKGRSWMSPVYRRAALVAFSAAGVRQQDIADILGISIQSVRSILYRMRKVGVLVDGEDRLDKGIIPAAIDALEADVLDRASPGHQKAYLAVLGGRGHLRTHTVGKETGGAPAVAVLNVKFEMPADGRVPVLNGQVVGVPRE